MKIALTAIVTVLAVLAYRLLAPWVSLEAQRLIANQMNNTDTSTIWVQYVGNGTGLLTEVCTGIWLLAIVLIWAPTVVRLFKQSASSDAQ